MLNPLSAYNLPERHCIRREPLPLQVSPDQEDFFDDFFFGILAPERRASLKAMATACLRLLTFLPLPDFSFPSLCSFMTLWTLLLPLEPPDVDFFGMVFSLVAGVRRGLSPMAG